MKWFYNLSKGKRIWFVVIPALLSVLFIVLELYIIGGILLAIAFFFFIVGVIAEKKDKENSNTQKPANEEKELNDLILRARKVANAVPNNELEQELIEIRENLDSVQRTLASVSKQDHTTRKNLSDKFVYFSEIENIIETRISEIKEAAEIEITHTIKSPLDIATNVGNHDVHNEEIATPKAYPDIQTVTVIDFETANHSFKSACSIGIAVIKGNEIIDKQYYLIQPPQNYYTDDNIAIHHIIPEDTANADTFPAVWDKIKHYFENTYLAAHNASFDMGVLKATLDYYGLERPHFEYVNTIAVSGYSIPVGANVGKSLDARCEYFGVKLDNHHNALCDAEAAAQLILCNLAKSRFKSAVSFLKSNSSYLKNYDDVKIPASSEFRHFTKSPNVNEIAASTAVNEERDADFDGKTFVITGEFKTMSREQALTKVVERGGIIKSVVSKKVDILVNADNRTSTKTKAAESLQAEGHPIKIITEEQFMRMLESNDAIDLDK